MTRTPWGYWHGIAFGVLGYDPEVFYRLTLKEWLAALRHYKGGAPDDRTQGLIASLLAMFDNFVAAKAGVKRPPLTALDFMPWVKRPPPPRLEDQIRSGLRQLGKRG